MTEVGHGYCGFWVADDDAVGIEPALNPCQNVMLLVFQLVPRTRTFAAGGVGCLTNEVQTVLMYCGLRDEQIFDRFSMLQAICSRNRWKPGYTPPREVGNLLVQRIEKACERTKAIGLTDSHSIVRFYLVARKGGHAKGTSNVVECDMLLLLDTLGSCKQKCCHQYRGQFEVVSA
jgi:hypothetical protein